MSVLERARRRLAWRARRKTLEQLPPGRRLPTNDRRLLEEVIFSALFRDPGVRRVLFVGVSETTSFYPELFGPPGPEFDTVDFDPLAASHGASSHHVGRFEELVQTRGGDYDVVVLNGVFAYGTEGHREADRALAAAYALLRADGRLLIGYRDAPANVDVDLGSVAASGFSSASVPGLGEAPVVPTGHTNGHTYACFRRP